MMKSVIQIIGVICAIYGVYCIILFLSSSIRKIHNRVDYKTIMALMVKDQEDTIEGIVRTVFIEDLPSKVLAPGRLTVFDAGSSDGTCPLVCCLKETNY
jgi:hypothetical protein